MRERRRSVLYKRTIRYLKVWIESANGSMLSTLSEESVGLWAGYSETKRIVHLRDDGSEEELDLVKIRVLPPPAPDIGVFRNPAMPYVPGYKQTDFSGGSGD